MNGCFVLFCLFVFVAKQINPDYRKEHGFETKEAGVSILPLTNSVTLG
jgi:hypothetical protein